MTFSSGVALECDKDRALTTQKREKTVTKDKVFVFRDIIARLTTTRAELIGCDKGLRTLLSSLIRIE